MTQFDATINDRISRARRALDDARSAGDDYLSDIHLGELESLARVAAEHGIRVEGLDETLAANGLATPSVGLQVVDLRDAGSRPAV